MTKGIRKWVLGALALAMLALLAAGCGGTKAERNVRITVVGWNVAADTFSEQAEAFEKLHPDIKVDIRYVDDKYTAFMPRLAAGTELPDIMLMQNRDFSTFLKNYPDSFLDITSEMDKCKDKFVPASWEAVTKDGKIYGMPTDMGPAVMFYRADLFEQAGIDASKIETWDDLIAAGKKLTAATNGETSMLGLLPDTEFFDLLLNQAGGNYVSTDDKNVVVNDEKGQQAMALLQKMLNEGTMRKTGGWDDRTLMLKRGQIAAVPTGCWFAGTISGSLPDQKGKWKVMALPAIEKGGVRAGNSGGSIVAIAKNSNHPEAAVAFLDFALNSQEGEEIQLAHGLFPAWSPIYETEAFKQVDPYFGEALYPFFAKVAAEIQPMHRGPITLDCVSVTNGLMAAVMDGKDVKAALDEAAKNISEITGIGK